MAVRFLEDLSVDGDVGIGTTSPDHLLQVESSGNAEIQAQRTSGAGVLIQAQSAVGVVGTNTNHRLDLKTNSSTRATISTSGNFGIGTTSPSRKLEVYNSSSSMIGQFESGSGTSSFICFANTASTADQVRIGSISSNLVLSTNYTERIRIDSSGNVGIGTTSPGEKLDVAGDIKLSGDIELGHASDTTIARASAGKVTIEGQPIQTKQMSMSHHNFYFNTTSTTVDYFVPFNSLTESSNPTITNYYGRMVAPYDGRIVKAVINTTAAIGTACSAQFWVATSSGVFAPSPAETVSNINLNTANTAATATFSGTSTAEFSEGDVVGLSIQKSGTTSTAYIQVTIVWEYTV